MLSLMAQNPQITISDLASNVGVSTNLVKELLAQLEAESRLKQIEGKAKWILAGFGRC